MSKDYFMRPRPVVKMKQIAQARASHAPWIYEINGNGRQSYLGL